MTIGIIGAMQEEVEGLARQLQMDCEEEFGRRRYLRGSLDGKEVIVVFSRMGKVAAATTVGTLLNRYNVSSIIFTGVAGALDPDLNIGDIVVSTELVQHDFDASFLPSFARYEVPLLDKTHFAADTNLVRLATNAAKEFIALHHPKCRVHNGIIVSGDQFITDPKTIERIRSEIPGTLCVEMEGAAVAQVCYEFGLPFVVIRAISDKANHDAGVDFPRFVKEYASPVSEGIVRSLVQQMP